MKKSLAATAPLLILALLFFVLNATGGVPAWPNPGTGQPFPPGWLGGVIPYVLDEDLPEWGKENAETTMSAWAEMTVLEFVPGTDEPDFIYFVEAGQYQKCIRQPTCVGVSRFVPNNEHRLGHGLGLEHEQQRRDRDRYVRVLQGDISPNYRWTWNPQTYYGADISPYNYQSVMHYDFLSSKRNRRGGPPAIETIPPHMPVGVITYAGPSGRTTSITPGDADTVARMVGLLPTSWTVSTNPLGLTVVVDGQEVTTPAVFDWQLGTEHTLSVPSPQAQPGGRYRFGRWSDDDGHGASRTVIAAADTTLYEANFVAAHEISTRVRPDGAGVVTISPVDSDGYYPLRSRVTMSAEPAAGSGFRFLRWEIRSDYLWQFVVTHETHGASANPAHTYAMPGLEYTAVFTQGPILRVESNADPTTVEINGGEYRTPVFLAAGSLPDRVTVSLGRDWIEGDKGYRDRFRSWSDGGEEIHVVDVSRTEDTILKLTVDVERRLEAWTSHDWKGSVLTTPPAEDGFYAEGTEVRLLAVARPPTKFIGWNGDVSGRDPTTSVVMDDGKLAEAVFATETAAELKSGVATPVSLRWRGSDLDSARYYVRMPFDASGLEVRLVAESATLGAEAGLWVTDREIFRDWVRHQDAHRHLRDGVATLGGDRPLDRRPTAWFILIRAAEADGSETQTFEGTLEATVTRDSSRNQAPQAVGTLENRTLETGGAALVLDVARAFSDPDGDALTYAAVSSSETVAKATAWGSTVTLTPVAVGVATVALTATDVGGSNRTAMQRFVACVVPSGGSAPPECTFTDHPIRPGTTPVRAIHFLELRQRIAELRSRAGLPVVQWTDPILAARVTAVRDVHVMEMRDALNEVHDAKGRARPGWTDPVLTGRMGIKAVHIMELRAAVVALEAGG